MRHNPDRSNHVSAYWEHYAHEADIGVRGVANSMEAAFEQAALALTAVITSPALVKPEQEITIHCDNADKEILFLDWLNALIFEMSWRKMLFSQFRVSTCDNKLTAVISGEPVDVERHQPVVEIKGATFTTLKVTQMENGLWMAQTVVDV